MITVNLPSGTPNVTQSESLKKTRTSLAVSISTERIRDREMAQRTHR